jgi:polysaccharide chain length determinant protein (PEP-CTERM system associated)
MATTDYELTLKDYLAMLKRHTLLIGSSFLVILLVATAVAILIPPIYQSTGTILVESQQVPGNLVQATITSYADERIEVIRQRVMTRENLMRIIDKYNLFANDSRVETVSEKVDAMREAITITQINADVKGKGQATIAFSVSYEHRSPEIANKVANELVTLFLNENVKQRTESAAETTQFLNQEAERLKNELDKVETQIAAYKQKYGDALPEHQELRMTMLSRTESDLKEVQRDLNSAQEEARFLDLELASAKAGVSTSSTSKTGVDQGPQDLGSLKAEYARLLSLYTEAHPDVRAVKRKIDALEAAEKTGANGGKEAPVSLEVAKVQTRIAANQAKIQSLTAQAKDLRGRLASYEQEMLRMPEVERGLMGLMRDHENAQKKYEEIRSKSMGAKISENMEQENKAERFILLEPPLMPDKPIKPNRKKILALGIFLALAGSVSLPIGMETINQKVRGNDALSTVIRRRVLVTIPYIPTEGEARQRKRMIKRTVIGSVAALLVILLLVHFLYMPLDILLMKILARFE